MEQKIPVNIGISRPTYAGKESHISIRIQDENSRAHFVEVEISLADFALAVTGLSGVDCTAKVKDLEKVGKMQETDTLEFVLPEDFPTYSGDKEEVKKLAKEICPEGWTPDLSFNSQTSFFTKEEIKYARTTIRRWVEK